MAVQRNINYLNRDFNSLRERLIEFSKTYFPDTYNDFTPSSTGMLFMEMAAYVGDIMSFYIDNQAQETFIQYARQTNNLYELAYLLGYKPKVTSAAITTVEFYQELPAVAGQPDWNYTITIPQGFKVGNPSDSSISFITQDTLNFAVSSSENPTTTSIYEITGGNVESYLLKKSVQVISARTKTKTFTFGTPESFSTVDIEDADIIGIESIVDSEGNIWYEVDYLGQDVIFDSIRNTNPNTPTEDSEVPYLLQTKQVPNRFTTRFLNETTLQLQFGEGTSENADGEITPNPNNVGLGLPSEQDKLTTAFSPTNFIFTNTYGTAPSNTTLTVTYLVGGGIDSNVPENTLTTLKSNTAVFNNAGIDPVISQTIFDSLSVNNPEAATGGRDGDNITEIRQNSLSTFQNQLRTVTVDDYLLRALSLPSRYGTIAKAYVTKQSLNDVLPGEVPSTLDLYVLSYNLGKSLVTASDALKKNLRTYLSQYRMVGDSVGIKDAYVVNIKVNFEIITYPNTNSSQVLAACIERLQDYFDIDDWQINEPILLNELYIELDKIEGVQTVKNIDIINKTGISAGYSTYSYDIKGATKDDIIYPSLDPMIFEIKYPNSDITGKVVSR